MVGGGVGMIELVESHHTAVLLLYTEHTKLLSVCIMYRLIWYWYPVFYGKSKIRRVNIGVQVRVVQPYAALLVIIISVRFVCVWSMADGYCYNSI